MRQLAGCVVLEEGLGFLLVLGLVALGITALLIFLFWFLRVRNQPARRTQDAFSVGFKGWLPKLTGPIVAPIMVVLTAIVVSIVLIVSWFFGISKIFGRSYFVALDVPSARVSLEYVQGKYQPDTQATI